MPNGNKASGEEVFLMVARRLAYPNRLHDLSLLFNRHISDISRFISAGIDFIFDTWKHLLHWNEKHLTLKKLREFASVITKKGAPLSNCIGFIDGTLQQTCKPSKNYKAAYNGQKKVHGLKYQCIVGPDGIITHSSKPSNGARHDYAMLEESKIYEVLEEKLNFGNEIFCIYGDSAYVNRPHIVSPFKGNNLDELQKNFNESMSKVRICIEWTFALVKTEFAFVDYKKNQKIYLQPIGKIFSVAVILTNCHTCFYGSETSIYFNCPPPKIEEYLQ